MFVDSSEHLSAKEKSRLRNNFAPDFFNIIGESLMKDIVISICVIVDEKKDVLSIKDLFRNYKNEFPHELYSALQKKFKEIIQESQKLKVIRDNAFAHISWKVFKKEKNISANLLVEIENVYSHLVELINIVSNHYETEYGFGLHLRGDGESIMLYLAELDQQKRKKFSK